jgi:hypothetical protein
VPFRTHRHHGLGLTFPNVRDWPTFICEACTVQAVLRRKLTGRDDWKLLCFERMHLINMAHYWAAGTHKLYQDHLKVIRNFEATLGFTILHPTPLLCPPAGPNIPVQWCQESYSLGQGSVGWRDGLSDLTLAFSTVPSLRSAVSQFGPLLPLRFLLPLTALPGRLFPSDKNIYTLLFGNSNELVICTCAHLLVVPGIPLKLSFGCSTAIAEGPGPKFPVGVFMVSFASRRLLLTKSSSTLGGAASAPGSPLTRSIVNGPFAIGSKSPFFVCK